MPSSVESGAGKLHGQLGFERLEELLLLSTTPAAAAQQDWRQETFSIGPVDQAVYAESATASGSLSDSALPMIGGQQEQQQYGYTGTGYSVAIIDTGIDYNNPAFAGRYLGGWNFVANNNNPMDDNGHGTHVAGIIASDNSSVPGIAPDVGIIALKVLDSSGTGTFGNVDLALQWVAAHQQQYHIVAVNMSLGAGNFTNEPWTMLDSDLQTLRNDNVFVAASAGNSYYAYGSQPGLAFPAINNLVASVGAVWDGSFGSVTWADGAEDYTSAPDQITSFTQRGPQLDILAPGAFITSTYLNDTFATMAGTSMAAPVVTGAAVDIIQALDARGEAAEATPENVLSIMQNTGVSIVDQGHGQDNVNHTGLTFKRLDLLSAIQSIVGGETTPSNSTNNSQTAAYINAIYETVLGRAADESGLNNWVTMLGDGLSRLNFVKLLWDSAEHRAQQVAGYYQEFLHRSAGASEINYWVGVFEAGASETSVAGDFMLSPEYLDSQSSNSAFIQQVFQDLLGRSADATSVTSLSNELNSGLTRSQLVDIVLASPERTAHIIGQYYEQYLGRADSAAEEQSWASLLATGTIDFETVAEMFLSSNEYFSDASVGTESVATAVPNGLAPVANDGGPPTVVTQIETPVQSSVQSATLPAQVAGTGDALADDHA
ncbi:MAG TPA: S8 family serine peptidase [Pirellulales bacterium]|nr:S8 family serine peptidase [Pirellulales bacterium]